MYIGVYSYINTSTRNGSINVFKFTAREMQIVKQRNRYLMKDGLIDYGRGLFATLLCDVHRVEARYFLMTTLGIGVQVIEV